MKRNKKKFAVAILLATTLIAASTVKRAAAQDATHGRAGRVSIGVWGGPDLEMQVTQQGAFLEFDCARGTISEPLLPDEAGKFQVRGTFQTQLGQVRKDQPSRGVDVVYSGILQGDTVQLEFTLGDNNASPEKFTLVRGQPGKLKKCR